MNKHMIIKNDYPLSEILWYKVGGKAKYYIVVESIEDVLQAFDFIKENHPKHIFICGLGSNLIFSDDYFDGTVVRIASNKNNPNNIRILEGGLVECFGGVVLDDLIKFCFENSLVGLEWAGGLPGTVGAGVRGNVGAFGGEIKDSFVNAQILEFNDDGEYKVNEIGSDNFHFSYRNSIVKEKKKLIVLSALFQLKKADPEDLEKAKEVYQKSVDYRKINHPIEYPTCGSVFKNIHTTANVEKIVSVWPETQELVDGKWHGKFSMGYIIKRLGLTGYKVGQMEVSSKHSNFIINLGGAKANDSKAIISEIQKRVHDTFGFTPEVEVEIVQ
jgi:UDP-N-acetylmuramate dehydrogenase